jgi:hypothetical protein
VLTAAVWPAEVLATRSCYTPIQSEFPEDIQPATVWINHYDISSLATPFGGSKQLGFVRDRLLDAKVHGFRENLAALGDGPAQRTPKWQKPCSAEHGFAI